MTEERVCSLTDG